LVAALGQAQIQVKRHWLEVLAALVHFPQIRLEPQGRLIKDLEVAIMILVVRQVMVVAQEARVQTQFLEAVVLVFLQTLLALPLQEPLALAERVLLHLQ